MAYQVIVSGADLVARELLAMGTTFGAKEAAIVTKFGQLYLTRVKARASGPPGPRVITGDYRRSINLEIGRTAGGTVAIVGTNAPQGRRLELGFVGTDSLGRHFSQRPRPHFEPDIERTENEMTAAFIAVLPG